MLIAEDISIDDGSKADDDFVIYKLLDSIFYRIRRQTQFFTNFQSCSAAIRSQKMKNLHINLVQRSRLYFSSDHCLCVIMRVKKIIVLKSVDLQDNRLLGGMKIFSILRKKLIAFFPKFIGISRPVQYCHIIKTFISSHPADILMRTKILDKLFLLVRGHILILDVKPIDEITSFRRIDNSMKTL